jgi:N-acetylmuramoyl-L-alanine amidase
MKHLAVGTCLGLLVLAGCQAPGRVLDPLPHPYHLRRRPSPPKPAAPQAAKPGLESIREAIIVIDAGHGGKDPGAWKGTRSKLPEEAIVLDIANRVASGLRSRARKVICTRTSDRTVSLEQRASTAERTHADLFVSIHADSAQRESASGVGVHIYTDACKESEQAAWNMVAAFKAAGIECRGIFRNNFYVLREHSRPALLVECGFLTNPGDARRLNTSSYRAEVAEVIVDGICRNFGP